MGKGYLTKYMRFIVNGVDLSLDTRQIGELRCLMAPVDVTGLEEIKKAIADQKLDIGISGYQAYLNDTTGYSLDTIEAGNNAISTLLMGDGEAPSVGSLAYMVNGVVMGDPISLNEIAVISANIAADGASIHKQPIGHVLAYGEITATGSQASIDNGVASTDGYQIHLHVLDGSGEFAFVVEHSTDDSTYTTLQALVLDGSVEGGEQVTDLEATVNRYIRFTATRTSGTARVVCTLAR